MDAKTQQLVMFGATGLVAGFLASFIVGGSGLIQYLISGVIGAFVGGFVLNAAGINLGISNPLVSQIATATIGAILVMIVANVLV